MLEDQGHVWIGEKRIKTTSVLGMWRDADGTWRNVAFPGWATLPSSFVLAMARRWHPSAAWIFALGGAACIAATVLSGRFRRAIVFGRRDCTPGHL